MPNGMGWVSAHYGRGDLDDPPGGKIHASPAVSGPAADQVLFVGDVNGTGYGLNLQTGARVFAAVTGGEFEASAAVAAGRLYFTPGGTLCAYVPS